MIKELATYTIICDNCGVDSNEDTEYSGWGDIDQAEQVAEDLDWHKVDMPKGEPDKHYCNYCWTYDNEGYVVINKSRTKIQ